MTRGDRAITILEGPAGAGKSTMADLLIKHGFHLIPRRTDIHQEHVRNYSYYLDDALRSQQKDLLYLTQALKLSRVLEFPPVIDRCILSQLVYGALRRKLPIITSPYSLVQSHLRLLGDVLEGDYEMRDQGQIRPWYGPLHYIFVILLPTPEKLEEQRRISGKGYPFNAQDEVALYSTFEEHGSNSGPIMIKFGKGSNINSVSDLLITQLEQRFKTLGVQHVFGSRARSH